MKKILLLSFYYPPSPAIGGFRIAQLKNRLEQMGWEIHLLTCRAEEGETEEERVYFLGNHLPSPKKEVETKTDNKPPKIWTPPTKIRYWKRCLYAATNIPDAYLGWLPTFFQHASRLIKDKGINILYTSSPPPTLALVGYFLKWRFPKMTWVCEFRDPWTSMRFVSEDFYDSFAYMRTGWSDAIQRYLEKKVLDKADRIIGVTPSIVRHCRSISPEREHRFAMVPNGFVPSVPNCSELAMEFPGSVLPVPNCSELANCEVSSPIRFIHAGSFYGPRTPRTFLISIRNLLEEGFLQRGEIEVSFYGVLDNAESMQMIGEMEHCNVFWRGVVPKAQIFDQYRRSDFLLLFAQKQPGQIPAKMYEYLSVGKPILAYTSEQGEVARLLRETQGGFLFPSDQQQADAALRNIITSIRQGEFCYKPLASEIQKYTYDNIARQVDQVLLGAMGGELCIGSNALSKI